MSKAYLLSLALFICFQNTIAQQIEAFKIGESSNAFSNWISSRPTLVCLPEMGDGVVATVYRQNIQQCGSQSIDILRVRFAISTDGGLSWDVGAGTIPPSFTGCYGKGPLPLKTAGTDTPRYPALGLFARNDSASIDSLALLYTGPMSTETGYFDWAGAGTGSFIFGLRPGYYEVQAIDVNGCEAYASDQVLMANEASPLIVANTTAVDCHNNPTGSIGLNLSGGSPPYSYTWNHGAMLPHLQNLARGAYVCEIGQDIGCNQYAYLWVKKESSPKLSIAYSDQSLGATRQIDMQATASQGSPPYSFQWLLGDTSAFVQRTNSGNYEVTATDANNCQVTSSQFFAPISLNFALIQADIQHPCDGNGLGSIDLQLPHPLANYSILWDHGPTSKSIQNLSPGTYTVHIYDSLQQCPQSFSYQIHDLQNIDIQAIISPVTCKGANDGQIDLLVSGGNANYQSIWTHGAQGDHLYGLAPGTYSCLVIDPAACTDSITVNITEPSDSLQLMVGGQGDTSPGGQGFAFVQASGGWGDYAYVWNTNPSQFTDTATNLYGGRYEVQVTDAQGCLVKGEVLVGLWASLTDQKLLQKLAVYPNPNQGTFWIDIESTSPQVIEIQLFDIQGKLIIQENLGTRSFLHHSIQTSQLNEGMYFLHMKIGPSTWQEKVMIMSD